jgi:hypothetical protein
MAAFPPTAPMMPQDAPVPNSSPTIPIRYPEISKWLHYCDTHPHRSGTNLSRHAWRFKQEGYLRIQQLATDRISVEKLSEWLGIGKGTADLIIQYAQEDVQLVRAGKLDLELLVDSRLGKDDFGDVDATGADN